MIYDCIVVGAGIAGMTAALYLKKGNKNVLIIEKGTPGGAINTASTVKNYPGIMCCTGPEFSELILNQIKENDIPIIYETVKEIIDGEIKTVLTGKNEYKSKYIILATGKENRRLNLKNEDSLVGKGLSYCALSDCECYRNKTVGVVGTGDAAVEEAIFLASFCKKVYLLAKYDYFKCQGYLLEELNKTKNIKILYSSITKELIEKDNELTGIIYIKDEIEHKLKLDGLFVYIGSTPNIFSNLNLELDRNFIKVNDLFETSVKGIYACGDVVKKSLYQLVTASSDGAIAATSIIKELNKK